MFREVRLVISAKPTFFRALSLKGLIAWDFVELCSGTNTIARLFFVDFIDFCLVRLVDFLFYSLVSLGCRSSRKTFRFKTRRSRKLIVGLLEVFGGFSGIGLTKWRLLDFNLCVYLPSNSRFPCRLLSVKLLCSCGLSFLEEATGILFSVICKSSFYDIDFLRLIELR